MIAPPLASASGFRVGAVQFRPPKGRPDEARTALRTLLARAGQAGCGLVVCPEMATTGYIWSCAAALRPHAEPADGPTLAALRPVALEFQMWIVVGFVESSDTQLFNSALVIAPDGQLTAVYRKNLLFAYDRAWASPGDAHITVDTSAGRLSPAICMDLNDDRFTGYLMRERPDVVAFCANWLDQGHDVIPYWRFRLDRWGGWFIASNTWGFDSGVRFRGQSVIIAPGGRVVVQASHRGDAILVADTSIG